VLVPTAWFLPELLGSGDLLRSGERALVANPGQPALAAVPAFAALGEGVGLVFWPLWVGVAALAALALRGRSRGDTEAVAALLPAAAGCAWLAVVAVMAQVGFSGEARYSLPGAVLLAVSGSAGLAIAARNQLGSGSTGVFTGLIVAALVVSRFPSLPPIADSQARAWRLGSELADVVDRVGSRDGVLACGTPYVGPLRGPLLAYRLGVARRLIEPDAPPRAPGVAFRSALTAEAAVMPAAPAGFEPVTRSALWEVARPAAGGAN
jgi:hypothetical protein